MLLAWTEAWEDSPSLDGFFMIVGISLAVMLPAALSDIGKMVSLCVVGALAGCFPPSF